MKPTKNSVEYPLRITVPVTEAMEKEVRIAAAHAGISKAQLMRDAVEMHLRLLREKKDKNLLDLLHKE
jgi:hypothetical protein